MKAPRLPLFLVLGLSLGGCSLNAFSSSSNTLSSSEGNTASSTSASSTSTALSGNRSAYSEFVLEQTSDGTVPVYDEATHTYTLGVSADSSTYTLSGYFNGRIVVANPDGLSSYKGVTLRLNGAYLENDAVDEFVVDYQNSKKYLAIDCVAGSVNYLDGVFTSVNSENNLRVGGEGALFVLSENGHGLKCQGDLRLFGNGNITVDAAADGLHGYEFYTNDGESPAVGYTGTLSIENVGEQAIDMCDGSGSSTDPWKGSIVVDSGAKIVISGAQNVARANIRVDIYGSLIAETIVDVSPIITKNTGLLSVNVYEGATFVVNGTALSSYTC